jgi:Mor family transcriptional regulator
MNITSYSREKIQEFVRAGVSPPEVLRDYDILMDVKTGANMMAIAEKNRVSERTVIRIKQKYG